MRHSYVDQRRRLACNKTKVIMIASHDCSKCSLNGHHQQHLDRRRQFSFLHQLVATLELLQQDVL